MSYVNYIARTNESKKLECGNVSGNREEGKKTEIVNTAAAGFMDMNFLYGSH